MWVTTYSKLIIWLCNSSLLNVENEHRAYTLGACQSPVCISMYRSFKSWNSSFRGLWKKLAQVSIFWVQRKIPKWPRPFLGVAAITPYRYLGFWRPYRVKFGLKMFAMVEFILALITTLSSKPFRFRVNRQKLNWPWTQNSRIEKIVDFSLNLRFRASRKQFLYPLSVV